MINTPPTFGMYSFDAKLTGAEVLEVWRGDGFHVDVDAICNVVNSAAQAKEGNTPKLLFLTSPNNPPERGCRMMTCSACWNFRCLSSWMRPMSNSLSKPSVAPLGIGTRQPGHSAHFFQIGRHRRPAAGLRHLPCLADALSMEVQTALQRKRGRHRRRTGQSAQRRCNATDCGEDQRRAQSTLPRIAGGPYLFPYPSSANFVLCRVEGFDCAANGDAAALKLALEQRGILVRYYQKTGLENCIRISVGRPEQTDRLLTELHRLA